MPYFYTEWVDRWNEEGVDLEDIYQEIQDIDWANIGPARIPSVRKRAAVAVYIHKSMEDHRRLQDVREIVEDRAQV
jgi:hypothetical protein